jgi:hypothetical protein
LCGTASVLPLKLISRKLWRNWSNWDAAEHCRQR